MVSFYLETFGCSLNSADSDLIVARLSEFGHQRVAVQKAEVLIINTCGVKEPTEDRIIHRIKELSQNEQALIITGCLPMISYDRIVNTAPSFAAMLGPQSLDSLPHILDRVLNGERGIVHLDSDMGSKLRFYQGPPNTTICTIPICEGCLGSCAYCAVRYARGAVRSYSTDEITDIVTRLVHLGYREIRLTSQDAGVFGNDTGESLVELLQSLERIPGSHRFRLGMFNPNLVLNSIDDLVDVMASDHFFKFFHVPLQSGSDSVLRAMNRQYIVDEWKQIVSRIRDRLPQTTIASDIIVGFPGETDADFEQTISLIEEIRPEVLNISKYGDRPHTAASKSSQKVDTSIKKNRSRRLSKLVDTISTQINESWIGWAGPVLVTEPAKKGGYLARTPTYRPVILKEPVKSGTLQTVRVTSSTRTHLIGEIMTES